MSGAFCSYSNLNKCFNIDRLPKIGQRIYNRWYLKQSMRKYPDMARFVVKAFYEKDPAVCQDIQESYRKAIDFKANASLLKLDPDKFIPGLDLQMMYRDMYWASEGYLWEMLRNGELDMDQVEKDFLKMVDFWKSVYLARSVLE